MLTDKIKNGEDISVDDGNITIVNTVSLKEKEKEEKITPDVKIPQAEEVAVQVPDKSNGSSDSIIPTVDAENAAITPQVKVPTPEVETPVVPSVEIPKVDVNGGIDASTTSPLDSVFQGMNFNNVSNDINSNTFSESSVPTYDNNSYNTSQNMNTNYDYGVNNQNNSYTMPSTSFNNPLEEVNSFVNSMTVTLIESYNIIEDTLDKGLTRETFERADRLKSKISELGIQIPTNSNTKRF